MYFPKTLAFDTRLDWPKWMFGPGADVASGDGLRSWVALY